MASNGQRLSREGKAHAEVRSSCRRGRRVRQSCGKRTSDGQRGRRQPPPPSQLRASWLVAGRPLVAPPPYARARKVHSSGTEGRSTSLAGGELRSPATPAPPPIKARQKNLEALLRWARIRPASLFSLQQQPAAATPKVSSTSQSLSYVQRSAFCKFGGFLIQGSWTPISTMASDEIIWQIINQQFCAFKLKCVDETFTHSLLPSGSG